VPAFAIFFQIKIKRLPSEGDIGTLGPVGRITQPPDTISIKTRIILFIVAPDISV